MYSIGEMSKKTGVTIRTLDYYDEIGLVKPSSVTAGGHRQYEEEDVMRLEQVLALKYMGFSLGQIRGILQESTATWQQSIQQQLEMVAQQQRRLVALERALKGVLYSIEFEEGVNWPVILDIISLFQQTPDVHSKLYDKYFDTEEVESIVRMNMEVAPGVIKQWPSIINEVRAVMHMDPASDEAQRAAERWMEQVYAMYGRDEELLDRMWQSLMDNKESIAYYPMDQEVINFIERAVPIMFERQEAKQAERGGEGA